MFRIASLFRSTALAAGISVYAAGAHADLNAGELLDLSLEQLSNIEVTSVSKRAEKANEAAAAVYVLTADDIRRQGATSIPEALRVVPGLNVARSGSHQWAITARGFNDQFANKLLVLIDGRTVYTPLFNGVWWDVQDVVLEDIDRIEVIRGPGATLWGANAVNGVINIITKKAADTQGALLAATAGNQERAITTARYGAKVGEDAYMRVYAKYNDREEERNLADGGAGDRWRKFQSGFRADWKASESQDFTLQGDVYSAEENFIWNQPSFITPPSVAVREDKNPHGANVLGRWRNKLSNVSEITLQTYYDFEGHDNVANPREHTFDVDFQHSWTGIERHEVIYGLGFRLITDEMEPTLAYRLTPRERTDRLFSAFVQDKFALVPESLFLTLGSKFEHNDYSGVEYQPSARLSWLISPTQMAWTSVSRALKTPYRGTDDGSLTLAPFPTAAPAGFIGSSGNRQLESEHIVAYEAGYRIQPVQTVSLDVASFYNDYSNLFRGTFTGFELRNDPTLGTYPFFTVIPENTNEARSYGVELAANWEVLPTWQLGAGYSYLNLKFKNTDLGFPLDGKSPEQQFNIRSTALLPYNMELNNTLYYVDQLPGIDMPDYFRFDARLAWKPQDGLELSLVGQNLLDSEHPEFSGFIYQSPSQIARSVFATATLRF